MGPSFPSSVVRKEKDLHGVHCAILSSDSITHQTLPGMPKDPRISQMPTVARSIASLFKTATEFSLTPNLDYFTPTF